MAFVLLVVVAFARLGIFSEELQRRRFEFCIPFRFRDWDGGGAAKGSRRRSVPG